MTSQLDAGGRMAERSLVISDFDGTQTDAEAGYTSALRVLTGLDERTFASLLLGFESAIKEHPHRHGVERGGKIVASAIVDPYLRMQAIAKLILDREGRFMDPIDRANLLEHLYLSNYSKTSIVPRQRAVEFMSALNESKMVDFCVVTNARTASVRDKLYRMGMNPDSIPLHGHAQKFELGPEPAHVPEWVNLIEGKSRVAYPRRTKYFEVLDKLRRERELEWSDITVVGDIFELDLLLPFMLGCRVILLVNDNTPQYEIDFITECGEGRAHVFGDLKENY